MTEFLSAAHVVHYVPGRLRLRIPAKRGDSAYFRGLAQALSGRPGIRRVEVNALAASVLVQLAAGRDIGDVASYGADLSLFAVQRQTRIPRDPLVAFSAGLKGVDTLLARASNGYLDVRSTIFLVLLVLALFQAFRKQFMIPGMSLLWYALGLAID